MEECSGLHQCCFRILLKLFFIIMQLKDIGNVKLGKEMFCFLGVISGGQGFVVSHSINFFRVSACLFLLMGNDSTLSLLNVSTIFPSI